MIRTAAIVFAFFIAGTGIGFVVGFQAGSPTAPEVENARESTPAGGLARPVPAASGSERRDGTPGVTPASASVDSESASRPVAEAIASIPETPVETGDGRFTGQVRTKDGEPVAGVSVRAEANQAFRSDRDRVASGDEYEHAVVEAVRLLRWRDATKREMRTGPDGTYELDGLVASWRYTVTAEAEGWRFSTAPGHHRHDEQPGETIDFVATVVIKVPIAVTFRDGTEPFAASIESRPTGENGRGNRQTWNRRNREIRLEPGAYRLRATSGDESEYASEWLEATFAAGAPAEEVTLVLGARPGIRGRVIFPPGEIPESARVRIVKFEGDEPPPVESLAASGKTDFVSQRSGFEFSFTDLEPGNYLLGASRGYRDDVAASAVVKVVADPVDVDLEIRPLDPESYVILRVIGPDGESTTDVNVSVSYRTESGSRSGGTTTVKREDGTILVLHEPGDMAGAAGLRCFVTVRSEKYGQREVEYVPGQREEILVEFQEPATLDVIVGGYSGSGYEGRLTVSVTQALESNRSRHFSQSDQPGLDSSGAQSLGPLEPGEYALVLQLRNEQRQQRTIAEAPVSLVAGANSARIDIPRLFTLIVVFEDAGGTRVQLNRTDGVGSWWDNTTVDETGRATFPDIPAGTYRVQAWGAGGRGMMEVAVPAAGEVRFEATKYNAMSVSISDPDGALARAGLRDGDMLIGVEGTEFVDMSQMQLLLASVMIKNEAKFTVMRGRERLTVTLETAKFRGGRNMGGNLEPAVR